MLWLPVACWAVACWRIALRSTAQVSLATVVDLAQRNSTAVHIGDAD
jgi:hypothetical protein